MDINEIMIQGKSENLCFWLVFANVIADSQKTPCSKGGYVQIGIGVYHNDKFSFTLVKWAHTSQNYVIGSLV